jgi:hypothetical protein
MGQSTEEAATGRRGSHGLRLSVIGDGAFMGPGDVLDLLQSVEVYLTHIRGQPRVEPIPEKLKTVFPIGPEHFPRDRLPES